MRNCDFWNKDEAIVKHGEYLIELDAQRNDLLEKGASCQPISLLDWLYKTADTGFAYDIGEIVNVFGKYDIVDEYLFDSKTDVFYGIKLRNAGGLRIDSDKKLNYKADVPKEVVELIRAQLRDRCPLRKAGCA